MATSSWTRPNLEMSLQLAPLFLSNSRVCTVVLPSNVMELYLLPDSSTTDFFESKISLLTLALALISEF